MFDDSDFEQDVVEAYISNVDIEEDDDGKIIIHLDPGFEPGEGYYYSVCLYKEGGIFEGDDEVYGDSFCIEPPERFKKYWATVVLNDKNGNFIDQKHTDPIMTGGEEFNEMAENLLKYIIPLNTMIAEEKDNRTLMRMQYLLRQIKKLPNLLYADLQTPAWCSLIKYKDQLWRWFSEKSPTPPPPPTLQAEVYDIEGKIVFMWEAVEWPDDLKYGIQVYCNNTKHGIAALIHDTTFHIDDPDPTKKFHAKVWSVYGDKNGKRTKSNEIMICKDLGKVLVNCTKRLREGYGVYEGYLKGASGKLDKVAVKIVNVPKPELLRRELKITEELRSHPNTVLHLGSGDVEGAVEPQAFIVLELCKKDTLYEMIKNSQLHAADFKTALTHIVFGLRHIHRMKILHRDLKPQNILCSLDSQNIKISDFGLGKQTKQGMSKASKSAREIGTEGWGSPENYKEGAIMSDKSDIYSTGLVFFFVLSGGNHAFGFRDDRWKTSIIEDAKVNYY